MAVADPNDAGETAHVPDAFLEQSYLTYIIPFATDFSPEAALQQGAGSVESHIANIEQRDQLFFGMGCAGRSHSCASNCSCAACR
jgi:hypothetical protein